MTPVGSERVRIRRTRFEEMVDDYRPLAFETFPWRHRFSGPVNHATANRARFWCSLRVGLKYLSGSPLTVVDLGTYPGSLLRLLHRAVPSNGYRLIGVGLMVSEEFRRAMRADSPRRSSP